MDATIGTATMRPDRTLEMQLRAATADGTLGDAYFTYPPNHPQYRRMLEHVGGLTPGQSKPVPPWD
ncbi:MAG: hypothetical protein EOO75_18885 [Myxococcales bacterium]|nr:MAG: hypothetical protein EOO75_18885 [Myxococcales bacterium]